MSASREKTSTEKVSSLTEELSTVRVERFNLRTDSDEMTTVVRRMRKDFEKSLSALFTEVKKRYKDVVDAVKWKIQEDFIDA